MYCTRCGTFNEAEARFCRNCGAALASPAPPPPTAESAPSASALTIYAGFWRRFAAYLIDQLILALPHWIFGVMWGLQLVSMITQRMDYLDITPQAIWALVMSAFWFGLMQFIVDLVYFSAFECSKLQATPGKIALGIIVVDQQLHRISFARALGRNLGKIISGMILSIGYIMAGLTAKKQALHDMLADCLVVMKR